MNKVIRSGDGLARLKAKLDGLRGLEIEIGVNGREGAVADEDDADVKVIDKAVWTEFGTKNADGSEHIPSRPWLRTAYRVNRRKWSDALRVRMKQFLVDQISATQVGSIVGNIARADVQASIRDGDWVPNAQITIDRKNSSKPLQDSRQMVQSIRYRVSRRGTELDVG